MVTAILCFIAWVPVVSLAQQVDAARNDALKRELTQFINGFADSYVNLPKSKNKQSVLKHFSPEAVYAIYSYNIAGKARLQNQTVKEFEIYLDELVRSSNVSLGYDLQDINITYVSPSLATVVYTVKYETKEENGIWVKGDETVSLSLVKRGESWAIVYFTIIQVEDEKLKGNCLCELFIPEVDDGDVVVKTIIPSGRSYATRFDNLEFRTVDGDWLIRSGAVAYKRLKTGEVFAINGNEEVAIGVASSKRDAVLSIIQHTYKDSCARLQTKK
ncbi:MAG: hypothetical protein OHK0039_08740 [Bacteroidia bacterium]